MDPIPNRNQVLLDKMNPKQMSQPWWRFLYSLWQLQSIGLSATIVTAKLTPGGANGSMTFQNGILVSQTPAT